MFCAPWQDYQYQDSEQYFHGSSYSLTIYWAATKSYERLYKIKAVIYRYVAVDLSTRSALRLGQSLRLPLPNLRPPKHLLIK